MGIDIIRTPTEGERRIMDLAAKGITGWAVLYVKSGNYWRFWSSFPTFRFASLCVSELLQDDAILSDSRWRYKIVKIR